jgi:hypothetical protein
LAGGAVIDVIGGRQRHLIDGGIMAAGRRGGGEAGAGIRGRPQRLQQISLAGQVAGQVTRRVVPDQQVVHEARAVVETEIKAVLGDGTGIEGIAGNADLQVAVDPGLEAAAGVGDVTGSGKD